MCRRLIVLSLSVATAAVVLMGRPSPAAAQFRLGPHLGYNFDFDDGFLGLDAWFGIVRLGPAAELHGNPAFSYYFTEANIWRLAFNFPFLLGRSDIARGIAAPGLGIQHVSVGDADDTDIGLNLIGGVLFLPERVVEPMLQLRVFISDDTNAELLFGLLFMLT